MQCYTRICIVSYRWKENQEEKVHGYALIYNKHYPILLMYFIDELTCCCCCLLCVRIVNCKYYWVIWMQKCLRLMERSRFFVRRVLFVWRRREIGVPGSVINDSQFIMTWNLRLGMYILLYKFKSEINSCQKVLLGTFGKVQLFFAIRNDKNWLTSEKA